jgi:hypothetical protein
MSCTSRISHFAVGILIAPLASWAHESFLPLHEHGPHRHSHAAHEHHDHTRDGKQAHAHDEVEESRWAIATGARYTRYSLDSGSAHLWETGLGADFAILPWLHLGGDVSYGWFNSDESNSSGLLVPHAHLDIHLPLAGHWEVVTGLEVGFPGGDEELVGRHWEWAPHVEIRHDRETWFVAAGASFVIISGENHEHHAHEESEEHHEEEGHDHEEESEHEDHGEEALDIHRIVDPHGERELQYYGAFGVRLLDQRLTVETRLSGVHVTSGDTDDRNYLRAGLRASWMLNERLTLTTEGSVPITDAERNQWQVSFGMRVAF